MHPPRPKRTGDAQGRADRLADWLLGHCPFCTVTVLSLLVIGPAIGPIPEPLVVAIAVVLADLAFLAMRRLAAAHGAHPASRGPRVGRIGRLARGGHPHSTSLGAK